MLHLKEIQGYPAKDLSAAHLQIWNLAKPSLDSGRCLNVRMMIILIIKIDIKIQMKAIIMLLFEAGLRHERHHAFATA